MAQPSQNVKQKTGNTERIRGPNLRVLVKSADGASFRKALELANKENLVLASNKTLSKALVETDEWKSMREAFACWTGTMIGYKEPGKELGKFIEYTDPENGQKYVFPVPEQYRKEKNMILVVEHPDFSLVQDGKNLVVESSEVVGLTHLPKEDGWYLGDEEFDIPTGKEVRSSDEKARYLWRTDSRVGSIRRIDDGYDYGGRGADLGGRPSLRFGVVVEVPEEDAVKIEGPSEQKTILEISGSIPEKLKVLFEQFSGEQQNQKLKTLPREELLEIAEDFAQLLRNVTLKD